MHAILKNPVKKKQYLLSSVDGLIVLAVFFLAYFLRVVVYEGEGVVTLSERFSWLVFIAVLLHLVSFYIFDLYNVRIKRPNINLLLWIALSVFLAVSLIAIVSYLVPEAELGRSLVSMHVLILVIVIFLWRKLFFAVLLKRIPSNNLLLIGSNQLTEEIDKLINNYPTIDYNLVDTIPAIKTNSGVVNMQGVEFDMSLASFVERNDIKTIVTGESLEGLPVLRKQLMDIRLNGVVIFDCSKFYGQLTGKVPAKHIHENSFIFSNQGKSYNAPLYRKIKKVVDVTFAVIGVLFSLPFFLILPIAIKLTSKGPVLFKQERLGRNEKPFNLLKFRTMIDNAEQETGPKWSSRSDPRITRLGRFLRKSRLDEIPQLINILKGEMSFVGPRPIRKHFADMLSEKFPFYPLRFTVKPGITGWAQVKGDYAGSEKGQLEKLEYELFYLQNQSFFLDLFIILKTIQTVLFRHGE